MRAESVPITFLGANLQGVAPVSGALLTAY
jgi:hypothetical protein